MAGDSSNQASFAWVEYDPRALKERRAAGVYSQQRRVVRAHVAHTSSEARKATIARRESIAIPKGPKRASKSTKKKDEQAQDFISLLLARLRSRDAAAVASMAQKSDRTLLWNAFTGGNTCFEAALFVSGTFGNTCGISRHDLHTGFGSGLLFLRGASLDGIQKTIVHTPKDSLNSISIALLAGWERRFGDEATYKVHLQAWKALPLSMGSLEDGNIAALADVAFICFQEATMERYIAESAFSAARSLVYGTVLPQGLPPGLHIIPTERPEALSLLGTVAKCSAFDWKARGSVQSIRRLILETLSWSASHSISTEPVEAYEESWDPVDLLAIYHVRSAMISANAPLVWACIEAHNLAWNYDVQTGIDLHAEACRHLRSHELMGTKYEDMAIWAKMTLVSHATDSAGGDEHMSALLKFSSIRTWEQMEALLRRHVFIEELAWQKYRDLFDRLVHKREHIAYKNSG